VDRASIEWVLEQAPGDELTKLTKVEVCGSSGDSKNSFSLSEPIKLSVEFTVLKNDVRLNPVLVVKNHLGASIFSTSNYEEPRWGACRYAAGRFTATCSVPPHILNAGKYVVDAMLVHETNSVRAHRDNVVTFSVFDDGATRGDYLGEWSGIVRPRCLWETSQA
jgi:lipopolysaccharide transport system ATP-binding protein